MSSTVVRYILLSGAVLLLALIILTVSSRIRVSIEYNRKKNDDYLLINLRAVFGLLSFAYEIPLIDLDTNGIKLRKIKKTKDIRKKKVEKKDTVGIAEIFDRLNTLLDFYNVNKDGICKVRTYIKGRLLLDELLINVKVGTGDASSTGIITGAVWTLIGTITSFMINNLNSIPKDITVVPDFNNARLDIVFKCSLKIKVFHAANAAIKFLTSPKSKCA